MAAQVLHFGGGQYCAGDSAAGDAGAMMGEKIKMPAPPLAPGQVEVKLGGKRYVLNVPREVEPVEPPTKMKDR
jgi:hypothetical protein